MICCSVLPSEELEHGLSFVLIGCKVLVSFSFFFYLFLLGFVGTCVHQRRNFVTWPFDVHPCKGFRHARGFVCNLHPSRRNLVTWPFDVHPFKGFRHTRGFVCNLHPSRRNLVTWPFDVHPFKGFRHARGFVCNLHSSRQNLVTQPFCGLQPFGGSSVTYIRQGKILLLSHCM